MTDDEPGTENNPTDPPAEDPVIGYILRAVEGGGDVSPQEIAQSLAHDRAKATAPKDIWRKYMTAVRQQAIHLARNNRLLIIRKGEIADPNDFKGLYKLRRVSKSKK